MPRRDMPRWRVSKCRSARANRCRSCVWRKRSDRKDLTTETPRHRENRLPQKRRAGCQSQPNCKGANREIDAPRKRRRSQSGGWLPSSGAFGAHHFGGGFGDEAARGEAFGLHHQAIHGAGNDEGLPFRQALEADAGNLVGGFGNLEGAVRLLGDLLKLGGGGARTESADVDAEWAELLGDSLGEDQVKSF